MRVVIKSVDAQTDRSEVVVISALGEGTVLWGPGRPLPSPGDELSVEFAVCIPIRLGQAVAFVDSRQSCFYTHNGITHICGKVEGRDEDGVVYLRLATDCLLMVESDLPEGSTGKWVAVTLPYRNVEIHPA